MNDTLSARQIREDLNTHGITALMAAAARGVHTLPDSIADHYTQLQQILTDQSDRFGALQDWRAAKQASNHLAAIYAVIAYNNADRVINDHLKPALADYLKRFRTDMETAGNYATSTDVGALLSQPDDIRQAHIRLLDSHSEYATLRESWKICRRRNAGDYSGTGTIDPDGLASPLAEVANMPDLYADWQLAFHGRKPWPWYGTAHHVRFAWLLTNGAEIVLPTGQEQDHIWTKYNPNRRVAA